MGKAIHWLLYGKSAERYAKIQDIIYRECGKRIAKTTAFREILNSVVSCFHDALEPRLLYQIKNSVIVLGMSFEEWSSIEE